MAMIRRIIKLSNDKQLEVSQAQARDSADIVRYLNQVGGETDNLTFGLNEFPLSTEEEEKFISTCLNEAHCLMLVGKVESHIVSHLYLDRSHQKRLMHLAEINVTVLKSHWGNSIGSYMVETAIVWAKENQITKLILHVRTDNISAIHLYKKQGFEIEGLITQAIKIGEVYYDNYIMGLSY